MIAAEKAAEIRKERNGSESGSRKKEYQLTVKGLEVLKNELERLRELVSNGDEILGGNEI